MCVCCRHICVRKLIASLKRIPRLNAEWRASKQNLYVSLEYLKTQEEMFEYDHKTFSVCVLRLI